MSQRIQAELVAIANEIEECGGVTEATREKLIRLLSNSTLLIALGPTAAIIRNDGTDNRDFADDKDFALYQDFLKSDGFSSIFNSERWGSATCTLEAVEFNGHQVPAIRVNWENKVALVKDWHDKELFPKLVERYLANLSLLFALKWSEWRLDLE